MGRSEEAGWVADEKHYLDTAPPAYLEVDPAGRRSTSSVASGSSSPSSLHPVATSRQFPATFNIYITNMFKSTYVLGERKDAPLYAVRMHSGLTSNPAVVLHAGPSARDDPALAGARCESTFSRHSAITLPGLGGGPPAREVMRAHCGWRSTSHTFTVEVDDADAPGGVRREDFEWRRSHGGEVQQLGNRHAWGWKLVRLGRAATNGDGMGMGVGGGAVGGPRDERAEGTTSDGLEVVAAWVEDSCCCWSKSARFRFLGSGLTGELGDRWALMAVITALRLWYLAQQSLGASMASANSAAAASVAAAIS